MKPAKYLLALMSAAFISACGGSDDPVGPVAMATTATTIDKVAQERGFSALLAAASKAGLTSDIG